MIVERVNEFLLSEAKTKMDDRGIADNYTFYPSSAGQCIRKLWNERKHPVMFSPETYKHFLVGNLVHDWIQKNIFTDGHSEVPIQWSEGELKFRGRIDCELDNVLYEFKTIKELTYVKDKPKPEHVQQLNMYLHARNLPYGVIVYITKNSVDILEHKVEYDEKLYQSTVKFFKRLSKYLITNKEPKPSKCGGWWACDYCKADMAKKKFIIKAVKAKKLLLNNEPIKPDRV
jgi:CRISPR-associated exonuclease Cas4